jgi:dynein heavy chain
MEEVAGLQKKCDDTLNEKNRLAIEVQRCSARLIRAEKLKHSLKDEKVRWTDTVALLKKQVKSLVGDVFLSAAVISYLGPFSGQYRDELKKMWRTRALDREIPGAGEDWDFVKAAGDPVKLRDWRIGGLPSDDFSAESGIIATKGERWPLMIDPQNQAGNWVKNYEGRKLQVVSVNSLRLMNTVEKAVSAGAPLLIEDFGETVEPVLDNILYKRFYMSGGSKVILVGDKVCEYGEGFRMYMTTNLSNPKYLPDVFIRTTVLNFTVTGQGLEEQLLADVVKLENPSLESKYNGLILSISSDKKQLASIESSILHDLHHARGHLLDNEKLVNALAESKIMSKMVKDRLAESAITEKEIRTTRESYRPAAARGSVMYFLVSKLVQLDPMYSYSLAYFKSLFCACIAETPGQANLEARLKVLAERTTATIHRYISRGLFEKHRLLFSFLLCCEVMCLNVTGKVEEEKVLPAKITELEWQLIMNSMSSRGRVESYLEKFVNPDPEVISEDAWTQVCLYCKMMPTFDGLCEHIIEHVDEWKAWMSSRNAHVKRIPGEWEKKLSSFQKLILLRCLCPEFGLVAVRKFIESGLGKEFVNGDSVAGDGMDSLYDDMTSQTPCLFVLSPGNDVMGMWLKFAERKGVSIGGEEKHAGKDAGAHAISLGQGQGPRATALIENGKRSGKWVLLQNVHLAKSWMGELERIVLGLAEHADEINPKFRLFLTSLPVDYFPIVVLQSCIKLTTEPPRGVKANVVRSLDMHVHDGMWDDDYLKGDGDAGVPEFRKLLYNLCVFHAVCTERKKFGSIGWNNSYDFGDSDLTTAIMTLKRMMEGGIEVALEGDGSEDFVVPMESLVFVTGQIVYGGRVTDDWDRRCLMSLISMFYCKEGLKDGYSYVREALSPAEKITCAPDSKLETGYFVKKWTDMNLPEVAPPTLFGMHANADFLFNLVESNLLFKNLVNMVGTGGGGEGEGAATKERSEEKAGGGGARTRSRTMSANSGDPDDMVSMTVSKILADLPEKMLTERASQYHKGLVDGTTNALSVVLFQEVSKFNVLLGFVRNTLEDIQQAIMGEIVMSSQLENLYNSILVKRIPAAWMAVGYPSLKGLEGWLADLVERIKFMRRWMEMGRVKVFWLPVFFFPQGFLTAVLQNYARKNKVAINLLDFAFEVLAEENEEDVKESVEDGVLVSGLWMQSTRWDYGLHKMGDEQIRKVTSKCPILHFLPDEDHEVNDDVYVCPCYKTMKRAGVLSTSGTSTSFVVAVELPTEKGSDYWTLRGAALLLSNDD